MTRPSMTPNPITIPIEPSVPPKPSVMALATFGGVIPAMRPMTEADAINAMKACIFVFMTKKTSKAIPMTNPKIICPPGASMLIHLLQLDVSF